MHRGIAQRPFGILGASASPAQVIHDRIADFPSASGRGSGQGRRIPFEIEYGHELNGLTHFDLLNHPAVYHQIRAWIDRPPRTAAAAA
jgi:hypothetical protein